MHLPAWKPDLIILNSRGSGNYKQKEQGTRQQREEEVEVEAGGGQKGRLRKGGGGVRGPAVWTYGVRIQFAHLLLS